MFKDQAFILLPNNINLTTEGLKYQDIYTYIGIRSFRNKDSSLCCVGYETIAKRMGVSRKFVMASVARLETSSIITVVKSNELKVANRYKFPELEKDETFTRIPYRIFTQEGLTLNEKAMLLCIRPFFSGVETLWSFECITDFAVRLGVSYKTVYTQYKSLVEKFYIIEEVKKKRDKKVKYSKPMVEVRLTPHFNWWFKNNREMKMGIPEYENLTWVVDSQGNYICKEEVVTQSCNYPAKNNAFFMLIT